MSEPQPDDTGQDAPVDASNDPSPADASTAATSQQSSGTRERSTIKFPYMDVRDATKVAEMLKASFGSSCSLDQMAGALNNLPTSGAFRTRLSSASTFGVIEYKRGEVKLTDLGHKVADKHTRASALVTAFLTVPLFKKLYDNNQGRALPQGDGLEREIENLGVVKNQSDRARQVFTRSAEQAGLFWSAKDRLVIPPQANGHAPEPADNPKDDGHDDGNDAPDPPKMSDHPLLKALWDTLPEGKAFTTEQRKRFFTALAFNIDYVYGPPTDGGTLNPEGVGNLWSTPKLPDAAPPA